MLHLRNVHELIGWQHSNFDIRTYNNYSTGDYNFDNSNPITYDSLGDNSSTANDSLGNNKFSTADGDGHPNDRLL